jgi:hypothetical protein
MYIVVSMDGVSSYLIVMKIVYIKKYRIIIIVNSGGDVAQSVERGNHNP